MPDFPAFPDSLKSRLAAANVTDAASLAAALDADPELRREYVAFLTENAAAIAAAFRAMLLDALPSIPDMQQLRDLWHMVPAEEEDAFLAAAEQRAAAAEASGDAALAAALRERINVLRAYRAEIAQKGEILRAALERLEAAVTYGEAWQVWLDLPVELEEWFLQKVADRATELEQSDDAARAERLRAAHAHMRTERNRRHEQANHPVVQALQAFLQAPTDADATRVFNERRDLLQPFEAQRELDSLVQQAPDDQRAAIEVRAALLRSLRGAMPEPRPAPPPALRTPESAGERIYINAAHAEGGGDAIVINNIVIERRWTRHARSACQLTPSNAPAT
ncbi:hypothetical protein [Roseiflexus castenholzii]|uniref:hypothetical protein n=1 Tax=Roseiflexus castenholzii TaxID=120962 RepID=UPI003C7D6198